MMRACRAARQRPVAVGGWQVATPLPSHQRPPQVPVPQGLPLRVELPVDGYQHGAQVAHDGDQVAPNGLEH
eukprot:363933-Chlamydomonas_euryale.AAC.6